MAKDEFSDFMGGMQSSPSRLGNVFKRSADRHEVMDVQDDDEVTSQRAQSRMGRPIGSITGGTKRAIDYKNKTFRISLRTDKLLQQIHKKTELPYRDILEAAVQQYAKEFKL